MKLFKVNITRTICVVADNDQDAKMLAHKWQNADNCEEDDFFKATEVNKPEDIPYNWKNCVPYCAKRHNLTMEETLAQKAASTMGG